MPRDREKFSKMRYEEKKPKFEKIPGTRRRSPTKMMVERPKREKYDEEERKERKGRKGKKEYRKFESPKSKSPFKLSFPKTITQFPQPQPMFTQSVFPQVQPMFTQSKFPQAQHVLTQPVFQQSSVRRSLLKEDTPKRAGGSSSRKNFGNRSFLMEYFTVDPSMLDSYAINSPVPTVPLDKNYEEYINQLNARPPKGVSTLTKLPKGDVFANSPALKATLGADTAEIKKKIRSWVTDAFYNLVKKGQSANVDSKKNIEFRNRFGNFMDCCTHTVMQSLREQIDRKLGPQQNGQKIYDFVLKGGRSMIENFRNDDTGLVLDSSGKVDDELLSILGGYSDYDYAGIILNAEENIYPFIQHHFHELIQIAFKMPGVLQPYIYVFQKNGDFQNNYYAYFQQWLSSAIKEEIKKINEQGNDIEIQIDYNIYDNEFNDMWFQLKQSRVNWKTVAVDSDNDLHFDLSRLYAVKWVKMRFIDKKTKFDVTYDIEMQIELIDIATENFGKSKPEYLLYNYYKNTVLKQPIYCQYMLGQTTPLSPYLVFNLIYNLHDLLDVLRDRYITNKWEKIEKRKLRISKLTEKVLEHILEQHKNLFIGCYTIIRCAQPDDPSKFNLTSEGALSLIANIHDVFAMLSTLSKNKNIPLLTAKGVDMTSLTLVLNEPIFLAFSFFKALIEKQTYYDLNLNKSIVRGQLSFEQNVELLSQKVIELAYMLINKNPPNNLQILNYGACNWLTKMFRYFPSGEVDDILSYLCLYSNYHIEYNLTSFYRIFEMQSKQEVDAMFSWVDNVIENTKGNAINIISQSKSALLQMHTYWTQYSLNYTAMLIEDNIHFSSLKKWKEINNLFSEITLEPIYLPINVRLYFQNSSNSEIGSIFTEHVMKNFNELRWETNTNLDFFRIDFVDSVAEPVINFLHIDHVNIPIFYITFSNSMPQLPENRFLSIDLNGRKIHIETLQLSMKTWIEKSLIVPIETRKVLASYISLINEINKSPNKDALMENYYGFLLTSG